MIEERRTIRFDDRIESYRTFFDGDWADTELARTKASIIYPLFFDLVRNWKAASNLHSVPLAISNCIEASLCDRLARLEPDAVWFIRAMRQGLAEKLRRRNVQVRPALEAKLHEALAELAAEADQAADVARDYAQPTSDDVWQELIAQSFFVTSIWALERQAYNLLYFHYESFLKDCVKIARGVESYQIGREFSANIREAFGEKVQRDCWLRHEIEIARLARHAFAHNGARLTDHLAKRSHGFIVEDGEIQVVAEHTVKLHAVLRGALSQMITAALAHPEFQRPRPMPTS